LIFCPFCRNTVVVFFMKRTLLMNRVMKCYTAVWGAALFGAVLMGGGDLAFGTPPEASEERAACAEGACASRVGPLERLLEARACKATDGTDGSAGAALVPQEDEEVASLTDSLEALLKSLDRKDARQLSPTLMSQLTTEDLTHVLPAVFRAFSEDQVRALAGEVTVTAGGSRS
jgi:hypothetical protein